VANTLTPLPLLAHTTSLGGYPQINPTLYFYSATGAPPRVYLAWNAGVQTTAAQNCAVYLELEYDDFV
ncbi:hypothetical protein ACQJ1F_27240, partial [Klebsiella pneumoniae]|uniref:hypothetical protein n=1 Tax=Klebsiella pneumoniae TaxID=573 RepID=UPI003CFD47FB